MVYLPNNNAQDEIAAGTDFAHGTDTTITLGDVSDFPTEGGYIRIDDGNEFAVYKYTGISSSDLTGLSLARQRSESVSSYTFPEGTAVELTVAADYMIRSALRTVNVMQTSIPNGDFAEQILHIPSDRTIEVLEMEVQDETNSVPSGLTIEVYDYTNSTSIVSKNSIYVAGHPIASKSGALDIGVRVNNSTGTDPLVAGGKMDYVLT